jgi:RNA polymerase sigma-70 factor, ECF subfamily
MNRRAVYLMADRDPEYRQSPDPLKPQVMGSTAAELSPQVVQRFRSGDREALAEVYRQFSRPVWGVAMTVLHDRQLAEDSVTETFLRAWRAAPTFDPARPLAPWLFTLARRCAIDVQRREFRPTRGGHAPEEDGVVEMPDISAAWEAWEVRSAVSQLPSEEQAVVRLAHLEGLTHAEIADELDVPLGTVKSRSHRAHRRLAERLRHLRDSESGR